MTVPAAFPALVGANVTLRLADWLGVKVRPEETPLSPNPAPDICTFEIVMFELPLFVSVTVDAPRLPTLTFPKLTLPGLTPSKRLVVTPVPLSGIDKGELGASLVSLTEPLTEPAEVGANTMFNVAFFPLLMVAGTERPSMLNPVPDTLACEIVRLAVPAFLRLIVCEFLLPVATLPKLALDGVAAIAACVPVPLSGMAKGEFGELLVIEMLPLAAPGAEGANLALNGALCPAFSVSGVDRPLMLKPGPDALAAEIVTLAVPEFFKVMVVDPAVPTRTLPKLPLDGVAAIAACVPVPLSGMTKGEFGELLAIEMPPLAAPDAEGANLALNGVLCPAFSVTGVDRPLMLKPDPEALAAEIVTLAVPEFVKVTVAEPVLPARTPPKLSDEGELPSPGAAPVPSSATVSSEFEASLAIEKLPLALPADCGAN